MFSLKKTPTECVIHMKRLLKSPTMGFGLNVIYGSPVLLSTRQMECSLPREYRTNPVVEVTTEILECSKPGFQRSN